MFQMKNWKERHKNMFNRNEEKKTNKTMKRQKDKTKRQKKTHPSLLIYV